MRSPRAIVDNWFCNKYMKSSNSWVTKVYNFVFYDKNSAILWFFVRIYVGWQWLSAGWEKMGTSVWTGSQAGSAVIGFLNGALAKASGNFPDVQGFYVWLITHLFLPIAPALSYIVTFGELAVGVALILGIWTGLSAGFGAFMNFNYLFAGTVSINPILLLLQLFLIKARKVAGRIGVDRFTKK